MRDILPYTLEHGRITQGEYGTPNGGSPTGAFTIYNPRRTDVLRIIANDAKPKDAEGWEHVSVSLEHRCPTWEEMVYVKNLFWHENETVVQFHPAKEFYVNHHPYALHMWRNTKQEAVLPPSFMIGPMSAKRRSQG